MENQNLEVKAVEEKKPLYISFSEYTLYRACPYKWHLKRVEKISEPQNEFAVFGKALHETIEMIIKEKPSKILYNKLFEQNLKKNSNGVLLNSFFGKGMCRDGVSLLDELDYYKRFNAWESLIDEEGKIVSIEEEINEELVNYNGESIYFKGVIDYIGRHKEKKNKYLILDWKTALKPWDLDKKYGLLEFNSYKNKLKNKEELTSEEKTDLQTKLFFGQLVLYQNFYAKKHNIDIKDIVLGYCTLVRQPISIQEYAVIQQQDFTDFIINDIKEAALEIAIARTAGTTSQFVKAKTIDGKISSCQYCPFKKDKCAEKTKC